MDIFYDKQPRNTLKINNMVDANNSMGGIQRSPCLPTDIDF